MIVTGAETPEEIAAAVARSCKHVHESLLLMVEEVARLPRSRAQTLVLTKLDEARHWLAEVK